MRQVTRIVWITEDGKEFNTPNAAATFRAINPDRQYKVVTEE